MNLKQLLKSATIQVQSKKRSFTQNCFQKSKKRTAQAESQSNALEYK
jgi:hypothetical protein